MKTVAVAGKSFIFPFNLVHNILISMRLWSFILLFAPLLSLGQDLQFSDGTFPPAGNFPEYIATGDFDGDGKNDVAYATVSNFAGVQVHFNDGNKLFDTRTVPMSPFGRQLWSLDAADLNNDGKDDLIATDNSNDHDGKILIAISKGRDFEIKEIGDLQNELNQQVIYDIDNDGDLDIVSGQSSGAYIYDNDGAASFNKIELTDVKPAVEPPFAFHVVDLDNDSKAELLFICNKSIYTYRNPDGEGYTEEKIIVGYTTSGVSSADFDNDGFQDIVIQAFDETFQHVSILFNDGTGNLLSAQKVAPLVGLDGIDHSDYNNDGLEDIIAATGLFDTGLMLVKNNGNRNFEPIAGESLNNFNSRGVSFVDLYGDATKEVTFISSFGVWGIAELSGGIYKEAFLKLTGLTAYDSEVADINKDGYNDIISSSHPNGAIAVWYGRADGLWKFPTYFRTPRYITHSQVIDINSDNHLDVLYSTDQSFGLMLGDGSGGFLAHQEIAATPREFKHAADLNNDNKIDVITVDAIYFGNGDGTFNEYEMPSARFSRVLTGNFNNDAFPDVMTFAPSLPFTSTNVSIAINDGTGKFPVFQVLYPFDEIRAAKIVDWNSDNRSDILVEYLDIFHQTFIVLLTNNGDGTFTWKDIDSPFFSMQSANMGDIDGDGLNDIVVEVYDTKEKIAVFLQTGTGDFNMLLFDIASSNNQLAPAATQTLIADMNKDQRLDIVLGGYGHNPIAIIYNQTPKADQTIAITPITPKALQSGPITVNATSTSGLPVSIEIVSGPATISGSVITPVSYGKISIKASHPGNHNYNPAMIEYEFCVNPNKPAITVGAASGGKVVLTSSSENDNTWYYGAETVPGTAKTFDATVDGIYSVKVSKDGCEASSDATAYIIAGFEENGWIDLFTVSPNPASSTVRINYPRDFTPNGQPMLFNGIGRSFELPTTPFENGFEMNAESLHPGLYIIKLNGSKPVSLKLIKK